MYNNEGIAPGGGNIPGKSALKGHPNVRQAPGAPFQGLLAVYRPFPGRCPGLFY